eukprot:89894-Pyramimonas_sp.AAC.1
MLFSAIQHPICSAAQPVHAIWRFMDTWTEEKSSTDNNRGNATEREDIGDDEDEGPHKRWRRE